MPELINYLKEPKGWKQGIYQLDSYEQYASIPALRSSELKALRKSPAHYRAAIVHKQPPSSIMERTFAKGKAFDVLFLHGRDAFEKIVTVEPQMNRAKKEYKEWKAANAKAECILSPDEKANILKMHEATQKKEQFSKIFDEPGYPHRVIVWQCSQTGIWCKAEIDWITESGIIVDLKSTSDAGFWFFAKNAYRLGYHNQGAFYQDGLEHVTGIAHTEFQLAAVEVDPPFESHVFKVSSDQLMKARTYNAEHMEALKWCLENDEWPGYPDKIMDLDSGQYIYEELEYEGALNGF